MLLALLLSFLQGSLTSTTKTIVPHEELEMQFDCPGFTPYTINTVNSLRCGATMMSTRHDGFRYDKDRKFCQLFKRTSRGRHYCWRIVPHNQGNDAYFTSSSSLRHGPSVLLLIRMLRKQTTSNLFQFAATILAARLSSSKNMMFHKRLLLISVFSSSINQSSSQSLKQDFKSVHMPMKLISCSMLSSN